MLTLPRVFRRHDEDYTATVLTTDLENLYTARCDAFNPTLASRIVIKDVKVIDEDTALQLAYAHLDFDLNINGYLIRRAKGVRRFYYAPMPLTIDNLTRTLGNEIIVVNGVYYNIKEILQKYPKGYYPPEDGVYPQLLEKLTEYGETIKVKVKKLNQVKNWRTVEDFYCKLGLIAQTKFTFELVDGVPTKKPTFKFYSPSAKTIIEVLHDIDYDLTIDSISVELDAELDIIKEEMSLFNLTVPDIAVIRDSLQAWKVPYVKISYEDQAISNYHTPKIISVKPKFQGFTKVLSEVRFWPDSSTELKKYYNDTLDRNIPNEIRQDLVVTRIEPNMFYNINHVYAQWLNDQPEEIQEEFHNPDIEVCPICGNKYNVNVGCIDPETEEYHVKPNDDISRYDIPVSNYFDQDGCFCDRVERYLEELKAEKKERQVRRFYNALLLKSS